MILFFEFLDEQDIENKNFKFKYENILNKIHLINDEILI